MVDYAAPKPVDPLWYQLNAFLRIECRCGRRETYKLAVFVEYHRLDKGMKLYQLIAKLRCKCGARPFAEVTRWESGNRQ